MSNVKNITDVGVSGASVAAGQSIKIPAQLEQVAEKTLPLLAKNFRGLLDNIDDNLFQLANQAENNIDQSRHFDAMREIRIKRKGVEKRFNQNVHDGFRKLVVGTIVSEEADDISVVSFDKLSLLQNDVLEENVAFSAMVSKTTERISTSLMQLNTRLNSILGNQNTQLETNPLGPTMVCQAMSKALEVLDIEITSKLILLKFFEQRVLLPLDKTISVANNYLIEMGVLPDFTGVVTPNGSKPLVQTGDPSRNTVNQSADNESTKEDLVVLDLLHELINGSNTHPVQRQISNPEIPADRGVTVSSNHLLTLLSGIQKNNAAVQREGGVPVSKAKVIDTLGQLNELVAQNSGVDESIGQSDQDMIQLVSMLFDVVLNDRNLADAMKVLIGRLQIPMIRIALLDESFFTRKSHPARKLLNEIATSTIGWSETVDLSDDPLYKKIDQVVDRIVNEFDDDASLIDTLLQEFMEFVGADRRRAERVETRTREAERGRARKEHARFLVQEAINQYAVGKQLPGFIVSFLRNAWSNWMFLVLLKEGKESEEWNEVQGTVETLVWSVLPNQESAREELFQRLPGLLASLKTGLKEISFNPAEMDEFFSRLEEVHLQFGRTGISDQKLVKPSAAMSAKKELPSRDKVDVSSMVVEEISATEAEIEVLVADSVQVKEPPVESVESSREADQTPAPVELKNGPESEIANSYLKKVDALEIGNWVNFSREESTAFRCKLVAILQPAGQFIFVNRNGVKVEERVRTELAAMLHTGELEILDDSQLFDRALESVIVGLRERNGAA
jgi:hypothetical protein